MNAELKYMAGDSPQAGGSSFLRRAFVPILVIVIGIGLTSLGVWLSQNSKEREQELLFENAVAAEQQNFESELAEVIDEFGDAVSFMSATFPASPEAYQSFFDDLTIDTDTVSADPGIVLVEIVDVNSIQSLEARERLFGQPDFQVTSFNPELEDRFVLTRSSELLASDGISPVGLDLRPFLGEDFVTLLESEGVLALQLEDVPGLLAAFDVPTATADALVLPPMVLIQEVNEQGSAARIGWAGWLFNSTLTLERTQVASDRAVNVSIELLGETVDLIDVSPEIDNSFDEAKLQQTVEVSWVSSEFTMSIWADDDFGVRTGFFEQTSMWLIGIGITLALFVIAVLVAVNQHLLHRTSFELNHARTLASTDPLTGLLNRKGFVEMAEDLDLTLGGTLFFIDLDGFKDVNDTLGHAEGDKVLRIVSQTIRTQFRNADLVSRFGGDEFMIFTPGLFGPEMEAEVAGRVVRAIADAEIGVTCSVGAAQRSPFDLTPIETLVRKADRAMYSAKEAGGNGFRRNSPKV